MGEAAPACASPVRRSLAGVLSADFALPFLLVFAFAVLNPKLLGDGDSYWHVAAGEWILGHGQVAHTDPFSYTFAGKDWHAHEWLAEVLFALFYRMGGWAGVLLLAAGAVAAAVGVVNRAVRPHLGWAGAAFASFFAFACMAPNLFARPHVLSLPLLALWSKLLLDASAARRAPSLWWLLLIAVWANLHGSVLFAVALITPFALEALIAAPDDWRRTGRQWGLFGVGAAIAMLATPRGLGGVLFLVELTRMASLQAIVEWMPPDLAKPSGLTIMVATGLAVMLWRGVKVPPVRILVLLVLLAMTLQHQRHQVLLAITGTMICAEAIGRTRDRTWPGWTPPALLGPVLALAALVLGGVRLANPVAPGESQRSPSRALAAVPPEIRAGKVLNYYGAGGYLIAQRVPVFIDGRTDLYRDDFFSGYQAIVEDRDGALDAALERYRIGWTFLETSSAAVRSLDAKPGWKRLYSDRFITVHVRAGENGGRRKD